jgi:TPP-dependent 2-oxoacid decarboxylase
MPRPSDVQRRIDGADALLRVCPLLEENNHGSADSRLSGPHVIDLHAERAVIGDKGYTPIVARDALARLREALGDSSARPKPERPAPTTTFTSRRGAPITQDAFIHHPGRSVSYYQPVDSAYSPPFSPKPEHRSRS